MKKTSMKETEDGTEKIYAIECMKMTENIAWMKMMLAEKPKDGVEQTETMGCMKMAENMTWMKMMLAKPKVVVVVAVVFAVVVCVGAIDLNVACAVCICKLKTPRFLLRSSRYTTRPDRILVSTDSQPAHKIYSASSPIMTGVSLEKALQGPRRKYPRR